MKICPTKVIKLILPFIALFLTISCNKDSDLLADYVVGENAGTLKTLIDLENGTIITSEDNLIAINILRDNQSSSQRRSTIVKKVTQPKNGKTEIQKDTVITYVPNGDFNGKDGFTYTVEETKDDNTTIEKKNTVSVEVRPVLDAIQDTVKTTTNDSVTIDVLNNDTFANKDKVTVSTTSTASKGTVVVNNDNTVTYTPDSDASGDDTFTYTVEVENADNTVSTDEGTVTVRIDAQQTQGAKEISAKVLHWKQLFDNQKADDDYQLSLSNSGDGGDIYYIDVSPYVYMFQATGEDSYMDFGVKIFQNLINEASSVQGGYLGWKDVSSGITNGVGVNDNSEVPLAESRGLRTVARMLWVMAKSPSYRAKGNNETTYQNMLSWFETNVWNKWESRGIGNLYRINTHMASHWGQIAWFLYGITGEQKYRSVYEGWSTGIPEGEYRGSSMRKQLREIPLNGGNGYVWAAIWGTMTGTNDVSHANAEVELMVLGAEMNDLWTKTDMKKIIRTFEQKIYRGKAWDNSANKINGSGTSAALWDQGWVQLGRFSQSLQSKLESAELLPTSYYYQKVRIGNLAYNQAYLENNLFYPKN